MVDRIANPPAGLLRRGSPVVYRGQIRAIVLWVGDAHLLGRVEIAIEESAERSITVDVGSVAIDLRDETGRAHLAAWVDQQHHGQPWPFSVAETQALFIATNFREMTPAEINLLARVALRAMGRVS